MKFKEFSIGCFPKPNEPVVLYNRKNNIYICINDFMFDNRYYKEKSIIRRWCGEDAYRKNIFKYYSNDVKWAYMKDIISIFFSPLNAKEILETDDTLDFKEILEAIDK